jgi:hypothetical protein
MSILTSEAENCMLFFVSKLEDIPVPPGTFLIAPESEAFT